MTYAEIMQDAMRYRFLRDEFASDSTDDRAEFAKLAELGGKEFDAVVDAALEQYMSKKLEAV